MDENSDKELMLEPEIIKIIKTGNEIQAIKQLRSLRNIGLKESKDIIDAYIDAHADNDNPVSSDTGKPKGSGKAIFMIIGVVIIFIIYKQLTQ